MTSFFEKLILVGALMVNICLGYDRCLQMTSFFEKLILVGALMVNNCLGYD